MSLNRVIYCVLPMFIALLFFHWPFGSVYEFIQHFFYSSWNEQDKQRLIDAWNKFRIAPKHVFTDVMIGFNINLDLIVPAIPLFIALNLTVPSKPADHKVLTNLTNLQETFAYFFIRGSAAERPFQDCKSFRQIVDVAKQQRDIIEEVGGNAAIMSNVMRQLIDDHSIDKEANVWKNVSVNLIGPIGSAVRRLLSPNIQIISDSVHNVDEVHVILEYNRESIWFSIDKIPLKSPIANRFIFSCDQSLTEVNYSDLLSKYLARSSTPALWIVSGFHLLESIPQMSQWQRQVEEINDSLKKASSEYFNKHNLRPFIHLELASMTSRQRTHQLAAMLLSNSVDSLGLNEQELSFLSQSGGGPHTHLYPSTSSSSSSTSSTGTPTPSYPSIELVVDCLMWLLTEDWSDTETLASSTKLPQLKRIHFHTLAYHILAVRVSHFNDLNWTFQDLMKSISAGAWETSRRACNQSDPQPSLSSFRLPPHPFKLGSKGTAVDFQQNVPKDSLDSMVLTWTLPIGKRSEVVRFVLSPVLVCDQPKKTVGLGDSISIAALLYTSPPLPSLSPSTL